MTQDELKQSVARAAGDYVAANVPVGSIVGVGTGSTANFFIDELAMIKGGGGALTREKIVAAVADVFVCVCDQSKLVQTMGKFPLPVEVIPMAQAQVTRALVKLGGQPKLREGFVTDNGNIILDVHGLAITDPVALEGELNQIVGVVCNGLFARRGADVLLLAGSDGVKTIVR